MYYQELEIGEEVYELLQDMAQEEYEAAYEAAIAEINTEYDNRCFGADEWEVNCAA